MMRKIAFYGARSIAVGAYEAVHCLYPKVSCFGFIVTSLENNPSVLAGLRVWELSTLKEELLPEEKIQLQILIATPETFHHEIIAGLQKSGFENFLCLDSVKESSLMERYYRRKNIFPSLHGLTQNGKEVGLCIFQAKTDKDKTLQNEYAFPEWLIPIQAGASLVGKKICEVRDCTGENISEKNPNYCELTALYWVWKQELEKKNTLDYYGLVQYRRVFDIQKTDIGKLERNNIDVILPFPTLCEPNIKEHHTRYLKEDDWNAMLQALQELQPIYAEAYEKIFSQKYFYNYNMLIAKKNILKDYCEWVFPLLKRTEELSKPKGWEREDRYIGYLGENLMTLYFMFHKEDWNIVHTGRIMLL